MINGLPSFNVRLYQTVTVPVLTSKNVLKAYFIKSDSSLIRSLIFLRSLSSMKALFVRHDGVYLRLLRRRRGFKPTFVMLVLNVMEQCKIKKKH